MNIDDKKIIKNYTNMLANVIINNSIRPLLK